MADLGVLGIKNITMEEVVDDFLGRRTGLIKALTTDLAELYHQCDSEEVPVALYGLPSGGWEVRSFEEDTELVPLVPDPSVGINNTRHTMPEREWISCIAGLSDAWLFAVAFLLGRCFDKADKKRLFLKMNDLPPIRQVVLGWGDKQALEKSSVRDHNGTSFEFGSQAASSGAQLGDYSSNSMQASFKDEITSDVDVLSVPTNSMGRLSISIENK